MHFSCEWISRILTSWLCCISGIRTCCPWNGVDGDLNRAGPWTNLIFLPVSWLLHSFLLIVFVLCQWRTHTLNLVWKLDAFASASVSSPWISAKRKPRNPSERFDWFDLPSILSVFVSDWDQLKSHQRRTNTFVPVFCREFETVTRKTSKASSQLF